MICSRSSRVWARNSVPSELKMVGSGQKVMVVPVRPRGDRPAGASLETTLPPLANDIT